MDDSKVCSGCGAAKPISCYANRSSRPCGTAAKCKDCLKAFAVKKREEARQRLLINNQKYCSGCDAIKPIDEFYKDKYRLDGRQSKCKDCQREQGQKFKEEHPNYSSDHGKARYAAIDDKVAYNKERYQKDSLAYIKRAKKYRLTYQGRAVSLVSSARQRAKKKGLPFDIDVEWVRQLFELQEEKCSETGLPFCYKERADHGYGFFNPFAPSLDQIKADKGYTKDNVRLVLCIVNLGLNSFGDSVFEQVAKAYLAKRALLEERQQKCVS